MGDLESSGVDISGMDISGMDISGVDITDHPRLAEVFTPEATAFVADLVRTFRDQRIDLLRARRERQDRLAAGATQAHARAKALLNRSLQSSLEDQLEAEAQAIAASSQTKDFREGVTAFVEKRKPTFTGE